MSFDDGPEIQIKPFLKFDDHDTAIAIALQNVGFIYVKEYMVEKYLNTGKLVEILPKHKKAQLPIYVYYRYQAYPDSKVQAFLKHFIH